MWISVSTYDPRLMSRSDPAEGNVRLPKILLNGNNICMVLTNPPKANDFADETADGPRRRWPDSP